MKKNGDKWSFRFIEVKDYQKALDIIDKQINEVDTINAVYIGKSN